jgi:penicillin-insensitive murein endopeptidase
VEVRKSSILIVSCLSYCLLAYSQEPESQCYGSTSNGRLVDGVQLPFKGNNFESYSWIGHFLGRTFVHSKVKRIIIDSFKQLEIVAPKKIYKYAETGFKNGSVFKPHKTHQNGLSIDFMVPVLNSKNHSTQLPTNTTNKFGYEIEFNHLGVFKDYKIDFEAMAAHIVQLHKQAKSNNVDIWRVIFDPKLQPFLFKTKYAKYLKNNIQFSSKPAWVRHDEHYHVDFNIECKKI